MIVSKEGKLLIGWKSVDRNSMMVSEGGANVDGIGIGPSGSGNLQASECD